MIQKITDWFSDSGTKEKITPVDIEALQRLIKYRFKDENLILQALCHRSFYVDSEEQINSNERLEFLGDAVLDLLITEFLYSTYKDENEGLLSQKKAVLVSRKVLGKISNESGFGAFLILNKGEEKTGGRKRLSNLANLFEAILGAIYIDGGLVAAKKFVKSLVIVRHKELLDTESYFNYKSSLLEFAQSKSWQVPRYSVVNESGPDHQKEFVVRVEINNQWAANGKGTNKKMAEQDAAKNTLAKMTEKYPELSGRK